MKQERSPSRAREDEAIVAAFMRAMAEPEGDEPRLPSPGQIWWRAQLLRRRDAAERAMRPLSITEKVGPALVALGAAVGLSWIGVSLAWTPLVQGFILAAAGASAVAMALALRSLVARN
ncbi:MAG TPA: hypothetical protein VGK94_15670 [Candidatus Polarisedimenticolia bacterium]|jgi:uncharacterized membrane protein YdfJ with MMPL/SSD domain